MSISYGTHVRTSYIIFTTIIPFIESAMSANYLKSVSSQVVRQTNCRLAAAAIRHVEKVPTFVCISFIHCNHKSLCCHRSDTQRPHQKKKTGRYSTAPTVESPSPFIITGERVTWMISYCSIFHMAWHIAYGHDFARHLFLDYSIVES